MSGPDPSHKKDEKIEFLVDEDLAQRAREKADSRGWSLSSVLRALLSLWVDEDVIDAKNVGESNRRARRTKKKK
jgi:hypothetical protein